MENLTPADTPDLEVEAPAEGEYVTAVVKNPGDGPVRPSLQQLYNKIMCVFRGKVALRGLIVNAANVGKFEIAPDDTVSAPVHEGITLRSLSPLAGALELVEGARLKWLAVTTGSLGGNPPRTTPLSNDLRAVLIPKAWVRMATDGANGLTPTDGANVLSVSLGPAGTQTIRVTFPATGKMSSATYAAFATAIDPAAPVGSKSKKIAPLVYDSEYVEFECEVNPRTVILDLSVFVFGRQSS